MDASEARKLTQRIYVRLNARRPEIERAEKYYRGDQPLSFATEEWRKANAERYAGFSDNWCASVVNAEAERLKPIGIAGVTPKRGADQVWRDFRANRFDLQMSQGIVAALTTGRAYAIVWGDRDGEPVITFEHPSNVEVEYDWENPRKRVAALKTWVDQDTEYATLYTPGYLFKWERPREWEKNDRESQAVQAQAEHAAEGGWEPRQGGDDSWPLTNPLGVVPVLELQNRPTLKGDPVSEIKGVMPMQDFINLMWAYLMLSADYASMDARVMLSADPPKIPILDKEGNVIGSRPVEMKDLREKRLINITGENAKIDSWKAAALDIFTDVIGVGVGHISSQTRTPPTYLVTKTGMSNVNGEGLKAAEIPLVMKSDEFIVGADDFLRDLAALTALVRGDTKLARAVSLADIRWRSREIRSESQLADALLKKSQMGYPFEYLLELDGRSPGEIKRILEMRKQESEQALGIAVQDALNGSLTVSDDADAA